MYIARDFITSSHRGALLAANTKIRREVFANRQILKVLLVVDHQALLVRQVQQTDEAITRRDVVHCLFGIYRLQVVDNVREGERAIDSFGRNLIGHIRWWRRRNL
jgi:hypothetical protein